MTLSKLGKLNVGCEILENVRPIGCNLRLGGLKLRLPETISNYVIGRFVERPIGTTSRKFLTAAFKTRVYDVKILLKYRFLHVIFHFPKRSLQKGEGRGAVAAQKMENAEYGKYKVADLYPFVSRALKLITY